MTGTDPTDWSYARYLDAKTSVEDRCLNRGVIESLRSALAARDARSPIRLLDVGGGTGTMFRRLVEWNLLGRAEYTVIDADGQLLERGRSSLKSWARKAGLSVMEADGTIVFRRGTADAALRVVLQQAEVFEYLATAPRAQWDVLIASAFLDLVELPRVLPELLSLLVSGGVFWFPINFDGETIFAPSHPLDEKLLPAYHRSMDERVRYGRPAGESRTGRKLFHALELAGAEVHAAGSSDWVVHATAGKYEADEEYFLGCVLSTIEEALGERGDVAGSELEAWSKARREQLRRRELVYIAHQLDFVGRVRREASAG
jgi:SAM-dependent methyltransferase